MHTIVCIEKSFIAFLVLKNFKVTRLQNFSSAKHGGFFMYIHENTLAADITSQPTQILQQSTCKTHTITKRCFDVAVSIV